MNTMNDLTRGERLQIMLTPDELKALDDWRFERRMPSRAAAVRELLKRGLRASGFGEAAHGSRSEDFGVTDGDARSRRQPRDGHIGNGHANGDGRIDGNSGDGAD